MDKMGYAVPYQVRHKDRQKLREISEQTNQIGDTLPIKSHMARCQNSAKQTIEEHRNGIHTIIARVTSESLCNFQKH